MHLDLDPGLVKIAEGVAVDSIPKVQKVDIEEVLKNLTGPLDVIHNASPDTVMANLEEWRPAMVKEVRGIEVAIERLAPGSEARRRWLNFPRVQRLRLH